MRLGVGAHACTFSGAQEGGQGWQVDGQEGGRFQSSRSKHAQVNMGSPGPRKPQKPSQLGEMPGTRDLGIQGVDGGMLHDGWHLVNPSLVQ
eukprot:6622961-Pyramimonas_sp.AAC.1